MSNVDLVDVMQQLRELREEVQRLRDEAEIGRLVIGYGPRVDSVADDDRARALAAMWAEGGEYDIGGVGIRQGRAEVAETYRTRHYENVASGIAHVMGPPTIEIDGDAAVAFNYSCVFRAEGEEFYPWRVSANEWHLSRLNGRWTVVRRVNRMADGDVSARQIVDAAARRLERA